MRYLGLDVGRRAIGLAVGELLAGELATLRAPKKADFYLEPARSLAYTQLSQVVAAEKVDAFVVGLPVNEDGQPTEESTKIRDFCEGLTTALKLPVHFVDETLTSFMATDMLESQGATAEEIERRVHQLSAELILQQFLENDADN